MACHSLVVIYRSLRVGIQAYIAAKRNESRGFMLGPRFLAIMFSPTQARRFSSTLPLPTIRYR